MDISTISKDKKFLRIRDIIYHFDEGEKQKHKDVNNWYGEIFEKLMSYPNRRLENLHIHILKQKKNGKKVKT